MKRTNLSECRLSRLEKIASDLRMLNDSFDVELILKPDDVKIRVRDKTLNMSMTGPQIDLVSKYCRRRGLLYILFAPVVDGYVDLRIQIF